MLFTISQMSTTTPCHRALCSLLLKENTGTSEVKETTRNISKAESKMGCLCEKSCLDVLWRPSKSQKN